MLYFTILFVALYAGATRYAERSHAARSYLGEVFMALVATGGVYWIGYAITYFLTGTCEVTL